MDMNCYIAGGAVRDLLLGRPVRDIDYAFDATEYEFIQRNPAARKIQYKNKQIYLLDGQEYAPLPPGSTLEARIANDILRRDFTINALLLSPSGILHLHPLSPRDLQKKRIRPASPSALADDPVRVFRAARLAASLPGFSLHEECLAQMRPLAKDALQSVAAEQVGSELLKACAGEQPGNFLRALAEGGCLKPWFAEYAGAPFIPAGPSKYHDDSVLEHTCRIMDAVAKKYTGQSTGSAFSRKADKERSLAVWMALCHDIGKTGTSPEMLPRHIGHEKRGMAYAQTLGSRLRLPSLYIKAGVLASKAHMTAGQYPQLRPGSKVDLLLALHTNGLFRPFAAMVAEDAAMPRLPEHMADDLRRILEIHLPPHLMNLGTKSGQRLRELRCMALS